MEGRGGEGRADLRSLGGGLLEVHGVFRLLLLAFLSVFLLLTEEVSLDLGLGCLELLGVAVVLVVEAEMLLQT